MHRATRRRAAKSTGLPGLEGLALEQRGYFRREVAHVYGISTRALSHQVLGGGYQSGATVLVDVAGGKLALRVASDERPVVGEEKVAA